MHSQHIHILCMLRLFSPQPTFKRTCSSDDQLPVHWQFPLKLPVLTVSLSKSFLWSHEFLLSLLAWIFFNVGPCFADVLFEIKAYSLSLFLSLFYPQLRRGSCYESHKQRALFACHQALRRIPFHHVKYSPYLLFLVVLLKNSFQIAVSDSLLFRRRGDDRGQGGDDLRVALMK